MKVLNIDNEVLLSGWKQKLSFNACLECVSLVPIMRQASKLNRYDQDAASLHIKSPGALYHKSYNASDKVSHSAPFCDRNVHTRVHFCYKMVHREIWDWCNMVFVSLVYWRRWVVIGFMTFAFSTHANISQNWDVFISGAHFANIDDLNLYQNPRETTQKQKLQNIKGPFTTMDWL